MDLIIKSGKISLMSLAGLAMMLTACTSNPKEATVTAANRSPDEPGASVESSPDSPNHSTPQQNFSSAQMPRANRESYRAIDLSPIESRTKLSGSDPEAIALSAFGNTDANLDSSTVDVSSPQPDQAIVILTQTRLKDDSVQGIRYYVEFQKNPSDQANEPWQMIWAGSQFKCYPGRGHQEWSPELCS